MGNTLVRTSPRIGANSRRSLRTAGTLRLGGSGGSFLPASANPPRVAVIGGDGAQLEVLAMYMQRWRWKHRMLAWAPSPQTLAAMRFTAVIVDVDVLGDDWVAWVEEVSRLRHNLGIVMWSETSTVAQRVQALRIGVDDWVTEPCHPAELLARVDTVRRRIRRRVAADEVGLRAADQDQVQALGFGDIVIERKRHRLLAGGQKVSLTRREFELLELLSSSAPRVLEREFVYESLWGHEMLRGDRSVDVFIRKLRQKLRAASPGWSYIHTHFGVGYSFYAKSVPTK